MNTQSKYKQQTTQTRDHRKTIPQSAQAKRNTLEHQHPDIVFSSYKYKMAGREEGRKCVTISQRRDGQ